MLQREAIFPLFIATPSGKNVTSTSPNFAMEEILANISDFLKPRRPPEGGHVVNPDGTVDTVRSEFDTSGWNRKSSLMRVAKPRISEDGSE